MNYTCKLMSLFVISLLSIALVLSVPASAAPQFGIFANEDNPEVIEIQEIRTHLFEAHKTAEKNNASSTLEHLDMANEELSQLQGNLTTALATNDATEEQVIAVQQVKVQVEDASTAVRAGNMTGVLASLTQADQQLGDTLEDTQGGEETDGSGANTSGESEDG